MRDRLLPGRVAAPARDETTDPIVRMGRRWLTRGRLVYLVVSLGIAGLSGAAGAVWSAGAQESRITAIERSTAEHVASLIAEDLRRDTRLDRLEGRVARSELRQERNTTMLEMLVRAQGMRPPAEVPDAH